MFWNKNYLFSCVYISSSKGRVWTVTTIIVVGMIKIIKISPSYRGSTDLSVFKISQNLGFEKNTGQHQSFYSTFTTRQC